MGNIFDFLGSIVGYLLWFFFDAVSNYALAIFLLIFVLNLLVLPSVIKRQKLMSKSARVSQKQQELRKKYEKDQKKYNEELAKLYEQEGNPMSGCLVSMLLPLLIFSGVWFAVTNPLKNTLHIPAEKITTAVEFLKNDPSAPDSLKNNCNELQIIRHFPEVKEKLTMFNEEELADIEEYSSGFNFCGINLLNNPNESDFKDMLWIIPALSLVLSILMSLLQLKLNSETQTQTMGCMKFTPFVLPLFISCQAYFLPGAIGFYWALNSLISGVQIIFLNKFYSAKKVSAKEEAARLDLLELKE
ncbi:MAG: membrane protein insertase YidC [Clostridia bacterium]|nr:membrane protein insertase YidC [Clostridia bacterium]